jgi:hypothetical protein
MWIPTVHRTARRAALLVFQLGTILGCAETRAPLEPIVAVKDRSLSVVPPAASGTLFINGKWDPSGMVSLPTYVDPLVAELRVDGFINLKAEHPLVTSGAAGPTGYRSPLTNECAVQVEVFSHVAPNGAYAWVKNCPPDGLVSLRIDSILVNGATEIRRTGAAGQWPADCNYAPCWSYSGQQTYSLTPIPIPINLATPEKTQSPPGSIPLPYPGNYIHLQASALPSMIRANTVPIRVVTWTWAPLPGGNGQTVNGCSGTTKLDCYMAFYDPGLMTLDAVVNGAEQIDTLFVGYKKVKITPATSQMRFSIYQIGVKSHKLVRQEDRTQQISVSVVGSDGQPVANQVVTLTLAAHEGTAGHVHTGGKPAGSLDSMQVLQVNTGATGTRQVMYQSPLVSGPVTIKGSANGVAADSIDVQVGLFTFEELPATSSTYDRTGAKSGKHVENHFATSYHIQMLQCFAAWYYEWSGHKAIYNDSSLPLGGIYDLDLNWQQPHATHSEGRATDFEAGTLEIVDKWVASDVWQHLTGMRPGDEFDTNHLHLMTSR